MSLFSKNAYARPGTFSWLGVAYVAFAIYILAPLTMVILMSFKNGAFMGFPIKSYTTKWYFEAIADKEFLGALWYSITIALASTAIAVIIGLWSAVILNKKGLRMRALLFAAIAMPVVVPGIVSAISMRMFMNSIGISPGTLAIVIGHASHTVPFVALMVLTRLGSMPPNIVEAARDLGADGFTAFMRVTVPYLMPALIGGAIFSMLSSFDDFIRSFFLSGYQPTLPILMFSRLFQGLSPQLAAISTIVLVATALVGLYAERLTRKLK